MAPTNRYGHVYSPFLFVLAYILGHIEAAWLARPNPFGVGGIIGSATPVWQHEAVADDDRGKAMHELKEAITDLRGQEQRLRRVAAALYAADKAGVRQVELVSMTGYNREQVRRHVEDEKIRRGEIPPTERYLKNLERAKKRAQEEG
jgi:hypothetical protein